MQPLPVCGELKMSHSSLRVYADRLQQVSRRLLSYSSSGLLLGINHLVFFAEALWLETRQRGLSIGDGILLAALCRTQTRDAVTLSKACWLREGKLRSRPIPSSALATKMTEFERL